MERAFGAIAYTLTKYKDHLPKHTAVSRPHSAANKISKATEQGRVTASRPKRLYQSSWSDADRGMTRRGRFGPFSHPAHDCHLDVVETTTTTETMSGRDPDPPPAVLQRRDRTRAEIKSAWVRSPGRNERALSITASRIGLVPLETPVALSLLSLFHPGA